MFAGLVLTSMAAAVMQSALFQRKSRSGWLEELDGIREDALQEHDGGVANVVDTDDIWTDLRDGGEYENPHEISSLYATDETPDLPVTKPAAKAPKAAKPAPRPARAKAKAEPAQDAPAGAPLPPPPTPMADLLPPPPPPLPEAAPPAPVSAPEVPAAEAAPVAPVGDAAMGNGSPYDDQIWVQPAPHPVRPSEMWHPAELAPAPLGEESYETVPEERVASADLMDPTYHPRHEPAPAAEADRTAAELESELVARADAAVAEPMAPTGGLVNGPVGRRVRRDRPAERPKASLPPPEAHQVAEREEQSPLPTAPLPPAALPTRGNRLPEMDLPATPSSVVAPGAAPSTHAPIAPEVLVEATPEPEPPAPVAPAPIAIGEDGLVAAPGTIVRIGGPRRAGALGSPDGVVVSLDEGWCWASPGEGAATPLRLDLPNGSLTVDPGATALAVVEADRSAFIVIAAGSAYLERGDDGAPVARGTIVMIDPDGAAQMDAATDAEIEADPIVAENLSLDAEL